MKTDWRHAVKKGVERDIVVLDNLAVGQLTRRLIAIMKCVQRRSSEEYFEKGSNLTNLLVPMEQFYNLLIEMNIHSNINYIKLYGVLVQGSYDFCFGDEGDLNNYYEKLGGSFPEGKTEIVIGMAAKEKNEEKRYLLGVV